MMSNPKLFVFILSYNRPILLKEALDSLLNQTYLEYKVIVSDNSSTGDVEKLLSTFSHPRFEYVKRNPSLTSAQHFNLVLNEAQKHPYFMMFHDDDILMPNALEEMMGQMKEKYAAVGCNGYIKTSSSSNILFLPHLKENMTIANSDELIQRYLSPKLSHIPFPFYIYNSAFTCAVTFDPNEGGKHADFSFLCKIVNRAPIYWIHEPLAYYRREGQNDSAQIKIRDVILMAQFILRNSSKHYVRTFLFVVKSLIKSINK